MAIHHLEATGTSSTLRALPTSAMTLASTVLTWTLRQPQQDAQALAPRMLPTSMPSRRCGHSLRLTCSSQQHQPLWAHMVGLGLHMHDHQVPLLKCLRPSKALVDHAVYRPDGLQAILIRMTTLYCAMHVHHAWLHLSYYRRP